MIRHYPKLRGGFVFRLGIIGPAMSEEQSDDNTEAELSRAQFLTGIASRSWAGSPQSLLIAPNRTKRKTGLEVLLIFVNYRVRY
jgi:hypothetical protein